MAIRVAFPPDGEKYIDFKNASRYIEDGESVQIFERRDQGCHISNKIVATFIKKNILGVYYV